MKTMNDSLVFSTLIKTPALIKTLQSVDTQRDAVELGRISEAIDTINRKMNYPSKPHIVMMLKEGRLKLIYNPKVIKTPKYLSVFGKVAHGTTKPVYVIDLGRYGRPSGDSLQVNPRTLYALMQNALVFDTMYYKWEVLMNNDNIKKNACIAYSKLAAKILIKLYAIDSDKFKGDTVRFLLAKFFLKNMADLKLDETSLNNTAYKACIGESSLNAIVTAEQSLDGDIYSDIGSLFGAMQTLPGLNSLSIRSFTENWVRMFGEGSALAIDYCPAFLAMIFSAVISGSLVKDPILISIAEKEIIDCYSAFYKMIH